MEHDTLYPGLVTVVRNVICWHSVLLLFSMAEQRRPGTILLAPFLAAGVGTYLLFRWFLRRPRTVNSIVALGGCAAGAEGTLLLWKCSTLSGFFFHIFGLIAVIAVVIVAVETVREPPGTAENISAMERIVCFFLFFLWFQSSGDLAASYSLPLLAASLLSLSVVICQRLASENGSRSRLYGVGAVIPVLLVVGLALGLFMAFGAEPLGQGVVLIAGAMRWCAVRLLWMMSRAIGWLANLFPSESGAFVPQEAEPLPPMGEAPEDLQNPVVAMILGILGLLAVAAGLIWVLFRLRKVRIGGGRITVSAGQTERKKGALRAWLRRLWTVLRSKWRLTAAMLNRRGSPQELYCFLVKAGQRLNCRRQAGETPGAFVRRAASMTAEYAEPELGAALELLADTLNISLYARQKPADLPKETARCIRRSFRKALRRQRGERLRGMLTERIEKRKGRT